MKVARGGASGGGGSRGCGTRPYDCNFTRGNFVHTQPRSTSAASGAKAPYFRSSTAGLKPRPSGSAVCEMASGVETFGAATEARRGAAVRIALAEVWSACGAFEWVTFGYLGWIFVLLGLFHRNVPHVARYFVIHGAIAAGIVCLAWIAAHSAIGRCGSRGTGIPWRFIFSFLRNCGVGAYDFSWLVRPLACFIRLQLCGGASGGVAFAVCDAWVE